jgi:RNA polymerase sigma factor (sigma-70 family)
MAVGNFSEFLGRLLRPMRAASLSAESDGQLVGRALAGHDGTAFEAIVRRHGLMVYRVCWRVLQHRQDTEDAFQATFLVLAQKLRSLRKHASLASWLHGVAQRVAVRAKAQATARRRRDAQAPRPELVPPEDLTWKDLRSVLDAELGQLPENWRLALILCYLEGRTQDEAAAELGWSKSKLRRHLNRGREALGRRLAGRGIAAPAALAAALLSDCVGSATPASAFVASTVKAAVAVAAGNHVATVVTAEVAALAEGALKTMLPARLKALTAVLLVAAAAVGIGIGWPAAPAGQPPEAKAEKAEAKAAPKSVSRIIVTADVEVDGERDIRLLSVDPRTGAWKKLSGNDVAHPRVSPDGQTVVFHRQDALWNCDTGGSDNPGKIAGYAAAKVEGVGPPVWSRDGKHFYLSTFHTRLGGEIQVGETWRHDADGRNPVKQPVPNSDDVLDVSPDGKHFLTIRLRYAPVERIRYGFNHTEVRVLTADGKESRLLSEGSAIHRDARFSPDGRHVVYCEIVFKKGQSLYVVQSDGKERRKIYSEAGTCIQGCCWSPDGKQIAAILYDWDGQGGFLDNSRNWRLEVIDADGKNRREIPLKGKVRMLWEPDWHAAAE